MYQMINDEPQRMSVSDKNIKKLIHRIKSKRNDDSSSFLMSKVQIIFLKDLSKAYTHLEFVTNKNEIFGRCFDYRELITGQSENIVAGGKRPFHTIIPAFMTKQVNGKTFPQMSFGVMGGDMQPQGHLQTVVRMLSYQQQPQSACDAPRWKVNRDFTLDVESNLNLDTVAGLKALGHELKSIEDPYMDFGSGQFIWRQSDDLNDGYIAASDSRRDGLAAGF
jgi:gamma-glutamyltranspeptidase